MTLLDCFNQHKGTAVLVPSGGTDNNGQCAQWADTVLHDVYGFPYVYTPAAKDWWYNFDSFPQLKNNFDKIDRGAPIKAGDFIIYDPLSSGDPQGHIDVASRDGSINNFWAYDSNWDAAHFHDSQGFPTLHEVNHADGFNSKVVGYLRRKGGTVSASQDKPDETLIRLVYQIGIKTNPDANDVAFGMKFPTAEAFLRHVATSPEHANFLKQGSPAVNKQVVVDYINGHLS